MGGLGYWERVNPNRIKFDNIPQEVLDTDNSTSLVPTEIIIDTINVHLPVIAVTNWKVSNNGVSYLASTPIPGSTGNSVLYGHNWKSLLGNLPNIKRGEYITIKYVNGITKEFIVTDLQIVDPNRTEVLENTTDTRLTLYTCTGFLDRKRFVVTAVYSKDLAVEI
jgi:LPXTG-site transpeptidase (sortase) family protein